MRRYIPLAQLAVISLSRLCTELVIFHHNTEHDVFFTTPKRTELLYHLLHVCTHYMHAQVMRHAVQAN